MPRKKAKNVVITPQRKAKANGKRASSARRSKKKRGRSADPLWSTSELDFDDKGRLIIFNQRLAREIEKRIREDRSLTVLGLGPIRPPPPPPPVDFMCGCGGGRLKLTEELRIHERKPPRFQHPHPEFEEPQEAFEEPNELIP